MIGDTIYIGKNYDYIGYTYSLLGDWKNARVSYSKSVTYYKKNQNNLAISSVFVRLGYTYLSTNMPNNALAYFDSAEQYFNKVAAEEGIDIESLLRKKENIFHNKAECFLRLNLAKKSILNYEEGLGICENIADSIGIARNWRGLGQAYKQAGNYSNAITLYLRAIKYYQDTNAKGNLADMYNLLGVLYKEIKEWNQSAAFYHEAKNIFEDLGKKLEVAYCLNNLGNLYVDKSEYDSGFFYLHHALDLKLQLGDSEELYTTMQNLGKAYLEVGKLDSAEIYLLSALPADNEIKLRDVLITTLNNLTRLYVRKEQYNKAKFFWEKAYSIAREQNMPSFFINIYSSGIQMNQASGNYQEALKLSLLKEQAKDSIYRKQKLEVQDIYHANQMMQKEHENSSEVARANSERQAKYLWSGVALLLLVTAIALVYLWIVNRQQKILKQKLFDSLNHRSRNDLQILAREIYYRFNYLGNKSERQILYVQNMIQALSLGYKAISSNPIEQNKSVESFVSDMAINMKNSYGHQAEKVQFVFEIEPIDLNFDQFTLVGFILIELLTNTFKHAFDSPIANPTIKLMIWKNKSKVNVKWEDNGVGLPKGINVEELKTEGLKSINALSKQLRGEFSFLKKDEGSCFLIRFPIKTI